MSEFITDPVVKGRYACDFFHWFKSCLCDLVHYGKHPIIIYSFYFNTGKEYLLIINIYILKY